MAMDAAGFGRRIALSKSTKFRPSDVARALLDQGVKPHALTEAFDAPGAEALVAAMEAGKLRWAKHADADQRAALYAQALSGKPYVEWLELADRAEQVDQEKLYASIWPAVNAHLRDHANVETTAASMLQLVEQLGVARFGRRPVVGDGFSGGGSIPFEAARLGCDVVASDLNPIACMLTWGALNVVGADGETRARIEAAQKEVAASVDAEITALGIEHNTRGDRAKVYLYCLETRCPQTGYLVPMLPSLIVSTDHRTVVSLSPDHSAKRFDILLNENASDSEMSAASAGTVMDGDLVVSLNGETYRTPIKTIRGDRKDESGENVNALRLWDKEDFVPRAGDIFHERLYAIQWITKETLGSTRQATYFAGATADDLKRERRVAQVVRDNIRAWQQEGLVPDMPIESGAKTDEPIRTRGWTHWHHLFNARQIAYFAFVRKAASRFTQIEAGALTLALARCLDNSSRLTRWDSAKAQDRVANTFSNQALNTLLNYACRAFPHLVPQLCIDFPSQDVPNEPTRETICAEAKSVSRQADIWITDPPYADAVRYEEITEFFIAWLRKNPPEPFKDWVWDSRRALAIKGAGDSFKKEMIAAYKNLAAHMPSNGRQIVMFTHQDAEVWADMAAIMWGAGLQVTAAWYVATETTSELKKGGYVQGTVLLVLRKRLEDQAGYRDEITQEITAEVALQIQSLTGLNDRAVAHGRSENLFEDADLQMAGYAAALRVLTAYSRIDGEDMAAYAARARVKGRPDPVKEIIDFSADAANSHLVPRDFPRDTWATLTPDERFYLKMVDLEAVGLKKLDNYQNFAKAFRADWEPLMASREPNSARLKTSAEFGRTQFGDGFGETSARRILWAMHQLQAEDANGKAVLEELRTTPRYYDRREDIKAIAHYLGAKRADPEGEAARTLADLIENERLG